MVKQDHYIIQNHQPDGITLCLLFIPIYPDQVVRKYIKLKTPTKMSTLVIKLARESLFGEEIMAGCTLKGKSDYDGLPTAKLLELKLYMI